MIETGKFLQQRYRIDKQIGQGGMGAVYVATDERFGSTVAIKETLCMSDNYRKAIEREARLLNSLKHSALPRVSDHFLEDDGQFLVMEFVPGDDLGSVMEGRHVPFPCDEVLRWADQLLDALDYLHGQSNPVVHRDIKPQNLKVTPKGQIVLLDFGLAKGNPTDAGNKTAAKSIFGYSRNYASLEQIQGTGTDPRSDLYSLAATLYHLMTGIAPEDALTRAMAVLSQQPDPLVPASSLRQEITLGVSAILANALDLNASNRPGSAAAMRAMLRDPGKYAHSVPLSSPAIAKPTETALFAHATRIHQETTKGVIAGNDAVTELMPDTRSKVTSIRGADSVGIPAAGSTAVAATRKGGTYRKLAFAAVFVMLGICAAAVGFIAYENGSVTHETPVDVQPVASDVAPPDNSDLTDGSSVFAPSHEAESGSKEVPVAQSKQTASTKPSSDRSTAGADSKASEDPGSDEDEKVVISGDSLKAGDVMMKKGKIVTPDGEIDLNVPVPPNMRQPGFPIDPKRLSPAQRRRLNILRQRHPEVFVRPTPY